MFGEEIISLQRPLGVPAFKEIFKNIDFIVFEVFVRLLCCAALGHYFQLIFQEDLDSHLAHIYLESKVNICLSESILVLRWV